MPLSLEAFHPTNTTTHLHSVDRWYNFIAGFSPEFVNTCLEQCTSNNKTVLDPFTGCGTVQVQANKAGWSSIGFEPHPIFYKIALAKITASTLCKSLLSIRQSIETGLAIPVSVSTMKEKPCEFLSKLFDIKILEKLLGARQQLIRDGLDNNQLAFLILSKILDRCSKSQTDGIYKAPTSSKRAHEPLRALSDIYNMIEEDLTEYRSYPSDLYEMSSRSMPQVSDESVSVIITSPPYLNNFDFAEMTRMQIYFWDIADSWGAITERVRKTQIVNTTTSLRGHKELQLDYRKNLPNDIIDNLDDIVSALRDERSCRAGKKEYDFLVYPYFSQMQDVLKESYRVLENNGDFHMMIADAALYGVHISTPQILSDIMTDIGFSDVECHFVRRRGHRWILNKRDGSKTGLGECHIYARKL